MENVPTAEEVTQGLDLTGQTAIVTGGNTGLGKEVVRVLALRNCHVILGSRTIERGEEAKADIIKSIGEEKGKNIEVLKLDLSNFANVREFVQQYETRSSKGIHYLFNNAGMSVRSATPTLSEEGQEIHFSVHHLSHYLLTALLLPHLLSTSRPESPSKIILTASKAQFMTDRESFPEDFDFTQKFNPQNAYGKSKLCNVMFSQELNNRLKSKGVISNSIHPGVVKTEIFRNTAKTAEEIDQMVKQVAKLAAEPEMSIEQGAASLLVAAFGPGSKEGGKYYSLCKESPINPLANDQILLAKLFEVSEKLTGVSIQ